MVSVCVGGGGGGSLHLCGLLSDGFLLPPVTTLCLPAGGEHDKVPHTVLVGSQTSTHPSPHHHILTSLICSFSLIPHFSTCFHHTPTPLAHHTPTPPHPSPITPPHPPHPSPITPPLPHAPRPSHPHSPTPLAHHTPTPPHPSPITPPLPHTPRPSLPHTPRPSHPTPPHPSPSTHRSISGTISCSRHIFTTVCRSTSLSLFIRRAAGREGEGHGRGRDMAHVGGGGTGNTVGGRLRVKCYHSNIKMTTVTDTKNSATITKWQSLS